jgi:hypothetical protein
VRPPVVHQRRLRLEDCTVGDQHLAVIRQLLAQRGSLLSSF